MPEKRQRTTRERKEGRKEGHRDRITKQKKKTSEISQSCEPIAQEHSAAIKRDTAGTTSTNSITTTASNSLIILRYYYHHYYHYYDYYSNSTASTATTR